MSDNWEHLKPEFDESVEPGQSRVADALTLTDQLFRQQQLFSIISHELRTPAATLRMLIESLDEGAALEATLPQMRQAADHLLTVLQDMRQAVSPARNLPMRRTPFHPNRMLEGVVAQMRRLVELHQMGIQMSLLDDEELVLEADLQRIKIVILNLIKNALLHSQGDRIWIDLEWRPQGARGELVCRVSDNGAGISDFDIDRAFEPFERLNSEADGAGLGLFIVRQTLTELNGSIRYQLREGGGSVFTINIPCLSAPQQQLVELVQESIGFQDRLKTLNILVVEDDPVIRMVSERLLGKLVHSVDTASNGRVGLDMVLAGNYDLILSDYFMPDMDGLEMIKAIRARGLAVPIISVTAAVLGQEAEELLAAGANLVVAKPISMKSFVHAVEEVVVPD